MNFFSNFNIGSRAVGAGSPVLIIAEAGVNHFGDASKADDLVDIAAEGGADVFKTQAFSTEALVASSLPEWRERLKPKEVSFDFIARMKERCDKHGMLFMCTAHDHSVMPWLDALDVPAFKIGSGERNNVPYFREIASRGKPVILSTGMYSEFDIRQAIQTFSAAGLKELAILHCVTSYPTPPSQINLKAMSAIAKYFPGPIGYSDHTKGHHIPLAAVAMGAQIIEKHITLDFDVPNAQDWKVSAGPEDFADFVREIREVEAALGSAEKFLQDCESNAVNWALKSLVTLKDLSAGTLLNEKHVGAKRPGGGIAPSEIDRVVGKKLRRDIKMDQALNWEDFDE